MDVDADPAHTSYRTTSRFRPGDCLRRARMALVVFWLAMFIGSHVKLHETVSVFRIRDKVLHFASYAGLAFLMALYQWLRKGTIGRVEVTAVWAIALAYGVFDELTQIPVGRTADPLDWLADAAGAAAGLIFFLAVRRYLIPDSLLGPNACPPAQSR